MSVPFFDITRQNAPLEKDLEKAAAEVIKSGRYILGPNVAELEKEFAAYCGTKFAIGVASGTDAIELALLACGIKEGDEVITTPFTFVATAEAIAYCGAKPVFVDIDPRTFNLDAAKIEAKITPKTRAILPVHLYGQACEMDAIAAIAKKHNLQIIEDCAQAAGAEFKNKKVGAWGNARAFSFFPTKNLGCFGDGGMITTDSETVANELKVLRNHGSRSLYHHDIIGFNSRLDELQAAILRLKLPHLDDLCKKRRLNARLYREKLEKVKSISLPYELPEGKHTYNQFTIKVKNRDALQKQLKDKGIGAMVYYPLALHLQTAFKNLGHKPGDFPVCETVQSEVLSLPIFPELTPQEIEEVCAGIR